MLGSWYGSAGTCNSIRLWDLTTGRRLLQHVGHEGAVNCLAFTADGRRLASGDADGVILWDLRTGRVVRQVRPLKLYAEGFALRHDGALLAIHERHNEKIHLFDMVNGKELPALAWEPNRGPGGHIRESIGWLRFSPEGKSLAAAFRDRVLLWRLTKQGKVERGPDSLATKERSACPGGFSRDAKTFVVGTAVGAIRWDAVSGKELARIGKAVDVRDRENDISTCTGLSPDGKLVVVSGNSGALSLWDTSGGKVVFRLLAEANDYDKGVRATAFSPDGRILASGDRSGLIRFWDVATGKEIAQREGHTSGVRYLLFSPDGRALASAGCDTTVLLWPVPRR